MRCFVIFLFHSALKKRRGAPAPQGGDSDEEGSSEESMASCVSSPEKKAKKQHMEYCTGIEEQKPGYAQCKCGLYHDPKRNKGKWTKYCCCCCGGKSGGASK